MSHMKKGKKKKQKQKYMVYNKSSIVHVIVSSNRPLHFLFFIFSR